MNDALENAIHVVAAERVGGFREASKAATRLVTEYGEENLTERIVSEVPASVPWEVIADLLGILEWSTSDNGAAIHRQAEQWLVEATDLRKIQVALHLDVYPFRDFGQMQQVLQRVAAVWPEVAARCGLLVEQRRIESQ